MGNGRRPDRGALGRSIHSVKPVVCKGAAAPSLQILPLRLRASAGDPPAFDSAHTGMESLKLSGIKSFLRRTKTTAELEALAASTFTSATEEVTITSIGTEGTSSSGQVTMPKWLLLQAIEDLLAEGPNGRQLFAIADRSRYGTAV